MKVFHKMIQKQRLRLILAEKTNVSIGLKVLKRYTIIFADYHHGQWLIQL